MNRLATVSLLVTLASCLPLGCQEKAADPAPQAAPAPIPPPVATPAPAPAPAPVAPAAPDPAQDLPAAEDFEQQALDEINPQNLEQELDKIEKEIGQ